MFDQPCHPGSAILLHLWLLTKRPVRWRVQPIVTSYSPHLQLQPTKNLTIIAKESWCYLIRLASKHPRNRDVPTRSYQRCQSAKASDHPSNSHESSPQWKGAIPKQRRWEATGGPALESRPKLTRCHSLPTDEAPAWRGIVVALLHELV